LGAIEGKGTPKEKLLALLDVGRNAPYEEAFRGGCPIVNLAIESDDADPELRDAARGAMSRVIGLFERLIAEGMAQGEFAKGNPRARASVMVASIEGGLMLTNLYKDRAHLDAVLDHLKTSVERGLR